MNLSMSENIIKFINKLSEAHLRCYIHDVMSSFRPKTAISTGAGHCLQLCLFELASLFAMSLGPPTSHKLA